MRIVCVVSMNDVINRFKRAGVESRSQKSKVLDDDLIPGVERAMERVSSSSILGVRWLNDITDYIICWSLY